MADIEVFRTRNTTGLAINGTRVTNTKPYGLIQTTQLFKCKDEDIIEALGADVQPVKRGRWKKDTEGYDVYIECSERGVSLNMSDYIENEWKEIMHYCPCCGADMRGEKE